MDPIHSGAKEKKAIIIIDENKGRSCNNVQIFMTPTIILYETLATVLLCITLSWQTYSIK